MPLIALQGASVSLGNQPVLHDLTWQIEPAQHFAILGGNGAGKSTFLRLLAGQIWPRPHHSRVYDFGEGATWSPLRARQHIALLSPEIQERFVRYLQDGPDNERGWQLDARTTILAGFFGSELLHQKPSTEQERRADAVIAQLGLVALSDRPLQTLSQGQMRRVLLARSLVTRPALLLLDEACSGLDAASRREMLGLIENLARSGETTLGLTTHREDEVVPAIQSRFYLKNGQWTQAPLGIASSSMPQSAAQLPDSGSTPLIELQNVSVFLDGTPILRDLNWTWERGQHFAIEGGNGAGKSTFLRLLRGELYPAHGGAIRRFGDGRLRSRATIGQQVGLLSPALQARYDDEINVETAVATGFFDSFGVVGPLSDAMQRKVEATIALCDVAPLRKRHFTRLSYGQRRRVLLARALVGEPQILLLDEALDGLDAAARREWHEILEQIVVSGASLAVVSHHEADYPPFLTHRLRLENGEIAAVKAF